ncbi:LysR substrate-binding domain-containing protein [Burkholderia stagnalis]|uniref:LysR substrate-binding domain-containing protein n=1 Tax=Burkholderia stagnalis TaxID=1503054 RepID=UPI000AAEA40D
MKIVVIGCTGLIGTMLVENLRKRGHDVLAAAPDTGDNTRTREGLAKALDGAEIVVDAANAPVWEDKAAIELLETSGRNLLAAGAAAGVRHHVALSIVGSERLTDCGYFRAKVAQEGLIKASGIPYTIVRATQFYESVGDIAQSATQLATLGKEIRLSPALIQPIASADVAAALAEVAVAPPVNGTVEVAGPEAMPLDELVRRFLRAMQDTRKVVPDIHARYFGGLLSDRTLTPGENPRIGAIRFEDWLDRYKAQSCCAMQSPLLATAAAGNSDALASSFATSYPGVVAFITVVAEGGFCKAADRLGITRSAVSRVIQKLEAQVGLRLLSRTTRSISLTREGEIFHARCQPSVALIKEAMEDMRDLRDGPPRGRLRVSASVGFGRKVVAPLLWGFQEKYPDIEIELHLSCVASDFTSDRIDVSFLNGRLADSRIVAKRIVPMQTLVCASPEYAVRRGMPESPDAVMQHDCINVRLPSGRVYEWEFKVEGGTRKLTPPSRLMFNDVGLVLEAVLQGKGIAQLGGYLICDLLREGKLVYSMPQYAPDDRGHYICYLSRQHLPSRIRVFVDHMTTAIRALDLQCAGAFSPTRDDRQAASAPLVPLPGQ